MPSGDDMEMHKPEIADECQRCYEHRPLRYHVISDCLDVLVCRECGLEAIRLGHRGVGGLHIEAIQ